jgi:hypothetical protein
LKKLFFLLAFMVGCAHSKNDINVCDVPENSNKEECKPRRISPEERERLEERLKEIIDDINSLNKH